MRIEVPKYFTGKDLKLAGIYFLFYRGKIKYIGQTSDLYARILWHSRVRKFTKARFILCNDRATRIKYEYRLIDYFKVKN